MDNIKSLTLEEIAALSTEKRAALDALFALDAPTTAQVEEAEALAADLNTLAAEVESRNTANDRFAALKASFSDTEPAADADADGGDPDADPDAGAGDPDADGADGGDADGADTAAADVAPSNDARQQPVGDIKARAKGVQRLAAKTSKPPTPARENQRVKITAAQDVPEFAAASTIEGIEQLAVAVLNRSRGFAPPSGDGTREELQKFGVATIKVPFSDDLTIDRGSDDMEVLYHASDEKRLDDSLVAAGWCSPSETIYDLASDESLEGILSTPEVNVKRGGIRYTMGPQFADFYQNAGFIQTEAQAIANTTKPCYEVDCPDFQEVRLDAVGVCIKVPILTNAAWPELIQRFTSGTLIAHQHMLNANKIGRMVTLAGAARVFTGMGSTVSDSLEALELAANQRRQSQRLPLNRTLEVVVPFWVKDVWKADLRRRTGQLAPVTDAQVTALFSAANLRVSFVYDWQVLDETAEVYPDTYNVLMYPAGTFVVGTSDVINLSAVYDAASLAVNTYTGLFVEQGLLVAQMQYDADLMTLPICNAGRVGAADFTCV